ncbi:hypothetical protein EHQ76_07355 [Leptospira barantonii]|uniref:Uncharacterized protein n=1 Tax=Leptospira barantonii TaxID=2023184 RepID=A0A5F2BHK9_9LEPT|nr:hypothetical protein EHQ76_07355 [Leptospira barantonii]
MNPKFEIKEGVEYKFIYLGLPLRGMFLNGQFYALGCFAKLSKKLKVHPDGYGLIFYRCSYIRVLILFLIGHFKIKEK